MRRIMRRVALAAGCIAVVGTVAGCTDGESPESAQKQVEQKASGDATEGAGDEDGGSGKRSAFGVPFPPKVGTVVRRNSSVKVTTEMDLDQIEQFFKTRLQDFEILRPAPNKIRVVGLYEYMPAVRGHQYGSASILFYRGGRKKPEPSERRSGRSEDAESESADRVESDQREREPGTPVRLKTDDGELLAPGAKWGEPYEPPPGTPLHKPRYRANWGKPIGEWRLP